MVLGFRFAVSMVSSPGRPRASRTKANNNLRSDGSISGTRLQDSDIRETTRSDTIVLI